MPTGHVLPFVELKEEEIALLNRPVTLQEVRKAVFSMKPYKAPGPDGIPPFFLSKILG